MTKPDAIRILKLISHYTIRCPPDGAYRGGTIIGVYKKAQEIWPWEEARNE